MKPYITKNLDYDLSGGLHVFGVDSAVRATHEKCTIEVVGTDMIGELGVEVSASGESFSPIDSLFVPLAGENVVIPLSGITINSYIKIKVNVGTSGVLTEVRYLFG